jgi:teichuronic acid biosynthesis glycosyltransferase TuaC
VKVLVLSHLYPAPGYERALFVEDQVKALRDLGVEPRVISPRGYAPRVLWGVPRLRQRGQTPRSAERDGVQVEYPRALVVPRSLLFSRSGDLFYAGLRPLIPGLREAGIDLVHAHQAMPDGASARRLASDLGVPYVVTVHGRDAYHTLRQGRGIGRATALVLREAAAVVAVSSGVARLLRGVVPAEHLHVVLNGISAPEQPVAPADLLPGRPLLLTTGYLIARKGHATVIEALARLKDHVRPAWVVVGEGPLLARLRAQAERLGVADQIHWLGRRPHDEVLALMRRADLYVMPSWDEAFGLVYGEALAQETPVVGCRGEGLEDFVQNGVGGWLVTARDAEALAEVIARVVENPATARAAGHAGREAVAGLTWRRNAERQLAIYEEVLAATRESAE